MAKQNTELAEAKHIVEEQRKDIVALQKVLDGKHSTHRFLTSKPSDRFPFLPVAKPTSFPYSEKDDTEALLLAQRTELTTAVESLQKTIQGN